MQPPSRYTANNVLHESSLRSGNENPECQYTAQLPWSTNTLVWRAQSCARQYAILQPWTAGPQLPGDAARTTAQLSKPVSISGLSRLLANLYYLAEYAFKLLEWQLLSPSPSYLQRPSRSHLPLQLLWRPQHKTKFRHQMQHIREVFWINDTIFLLPFYPTEWWDNKPVLSFSHKLKVNNCPKSLEPLLKALNGFECFHTAGGKTPGPSLPGLVSEEDTLGANQSLSEYWISLSQAPPSVLTPILLKLTLKFCFGYQTFLKLRKMGRKEASQVEAPGS